MNSEVNVEELEKIFSDYRKNNNTGPGKKYPDEYKELVRKAHEKGLSLRKLSLLCQLHSEVIKRWVVRNKSGKFLFRELTVVENSPHSQNQQVKDQSEITVELPNGIKIQIPINYFSTEIVYVLGSVVLRSS